MLLQDQLISSFLELSSQDIVAEENKGISIDLRLYIVIELLNLEFNSFSVFLC